MNTAAVPSIPLALDPWRVLAAELALEEDRERYRLARSVHDGLCQTLNLLSLQLGMAQRLSPAGEAKVSLAEMGELIKEAGRSAQKLMFDLSPPVLHILGLLPAVQWLAEQLEARHGLKVRLTDDGQAKELDETTKLLLFRAVRELLANVVKHAGVSGATVELRHQGDELVVTVDDRGAGFDATAARMRRTRGLPGVLAWTEYLGGRLEIHTAPGCGTNITLIVPMPATENLP